MERYKLMERMRNPRGRSLVQNEAWRRVRRDRGIIKRHKGFDIFEEEYETVTEKTWTDIGIGEERRKKKINDEEMIDRVLQRYELEEDRMTLKLAGRVGRRTPRPRDEY